MRSIKRAFALTALTFAVTAAPAVASAGNLVPKEGGHTVASSTTYANVSTGRAATAGMSGSTAAAKASQGIKVTGERKFTLFGGTLFGRRTTASSKQSTEAAMDLATGERAAERSLSGRATTTTTAAFGAFKSQTHDYMRASAGTDGTSSSQIATKKTSFLGGLLSKFGFSRHQTATGADGEFRDATHTGSGTSLAGSGSEKKSTNIRTNTHTYESTESTMSGPGVTAGKSDTKMSFGDGERKYETKQAGVVGPAGFGVVSQTDSKNTPTTQAAGKKLRLGRLAP